MSLYVQMCSCMMIYANLDFSDRVVYFFNVDLSILYHEHIQRYSAPHFDRDMQWCTMVLDIGTILEKVKDRTFFTAP